VFVKEVEKVICGHKMMRIKESVSWQTDERISQLSDQNKRDFYSLVDKGLSLGAICREMNIGLLVAAQLTIRAFRNPYKDCGEGC
jgi:hypothetical protein